MCRVWRGSPQQSKHARRGPEPVRRLREQRVLHYQSSPVDSTGGSRSVMSMNSETTASWRTICPYCGVGCGLKVEVEQGLVARVRGDVSHPGTKGMLCRKAVYLPQTMN